MVIDPFLNYNFRGVWLTVSFLHCIIGQEVGLVFNKMNMTNISEIMALLLHSRCVVYNTTFIFLKLFLVYMYVDYTTVAAIIYSIYKLKIHKINLLFVLYYICTCKKLFCILQFWCQVNVRILHSFNLWKKTANQLFLSKFQCRYMNVREKTCRTKKVKM